MTRDAWDWGFAGFAEKEEPPEPSADPRPAPAPLLEMVDDEEPTASRPQPALAAGGALEDHLFKLQRARTQDERQAAAAEALRFLARHGHRADDDPTVVDRTLPESVLHARAASMSSDSAPG